MLPCQCKGIADLPPREIQERVGWCGCRVFLAVSLLFDRQCPVCDRSEGVNVVMETRNDDLCALSSEDFENGWTAEAQDYMGTR